MNLEQQLKPEQLVRLVALELLVLLEPPQTREQLDATDLLDREELLVSKEHPERQVRLELPELLERLDLLAFVDKRVQLELPDSRQIRERRDPLE